MTDEEKKAIERIEKLVEYLKKWNKNFTVVPEDVKYFEKILDMTKTHIRMIDENIEEILEQSKEIEELKEDNKHQWEERCKLTFELENSTSNDKIKAKIEEYKKQIEKMEKDDIGRGFTLGKEWSDLKAKVEFGQSLLEKE